MARWTVEVGSLGELPKASLHYVRAAPFQAGAIEAVIPEWRSDIAGGDLITVKRNGIVKARGKVYTIDPVETSEGLWMRLTGAGPEKKHAETDVANRNENTRPHTIISNNLTDTDLTAGTLDDYGSDIAMEFGTSDDAKWSRGDAYEEVAFVTGWELYRSPLGVLDFRAQCGVDRGKTPTGGYGTVAFKHGENVYEWVKPHRENHLQKASRVVVLGSLEDTYQNVGVAGSGSPVRRIPRKNLVSNGTCQSAAEAVLADIQNPIVSGVISVDDEGLEYDVYDTVWVYHSRFSDADYRVYRIEKWVDGEDGETTHVTYTNLTKLASNGPLLLEAGKEGLMAGQAALRHLTSSRLNVINLGALDASRNVDLSSTGVVGAVGTGKIEDDAVNQDKLNVSGVDSAGKILLTQIGGGTIDNVPDGSSYAKVLASYLASGKVKQLTFADISTVDAADYPNHVAHDQATDQLYYSNGTIWLDTGLTGSDIWGYSNRQMTYTPAVETWYGSGIHGNVTISTNTDLGDDSVKFYNNLTVNSGITLSGNSPMFIFVAGTLTLNGTIAVNPATTGGDGPAKTEAGDGGDGGGGGGIIFVYAKAVLGSGKITANGAAGQDGGDSIAANSNDSGTPGGDGEGAECLGVTYTAAQGAGDGSREIKGVAGATVDQSEFKRWLLTLIAEYGQYSVSHLNALCFGGSGGGGSSGTEYTTFSNESEGGGGGGGGSLFEAGGDGGNGGAGYNSSNRSSGGGGGGGGAGGIVVLVSEDAVTTLTLEAKGGDGGAGGDCGDPKAGGGGGGGGGAGGYIITIVDVEPSTKTVTGGSGGAKGLGDISARDGYAGSSGSSGATFRYPVSKFRTNIAYTPP